MSSLLRSAQVYVDRIASLEPDTPMEIESSDDLVLKAGAGKDIKTTSPVVHADKVTHLDDVTFGDASMPVPVGTAPMFACRAWVNFDGTTTPPTIRAGGNVESVARLDTGHYLVTFTEALPDANYVVTLTGNFDMGGAPGMHNPVTFTATGYSITTRHYDTGSRQNFSRIYTAVFR